MKPEGFPLPWCDKLDKAYYQINISLIFNKEGWGEKQSHVPMSEIIPWIDKLIEEDYFK